MSKCELDYVYVNSLCRTCIEMHQRGTLSDERFAQCGGYQGHSREWRRLAGRERGAVDGLTEAGAEYPGKAEGN